MTNINKKELKKKLIETYQRYIENPESEKLKKEAFQIYKTYSGASIFLDKSHR